MKLFTSCVILFLVQCSVKCSNNLNRHGLNRHGLNRPNLNTGADRTRPNAIRDNSCVEGSTDLITVDLKEISVNHLLTNNFAHDEAPIIVHMDPAKVKTKDPKTNKDINIEIVNFGLVEFKDTRPGNTDKKVYILRTRDRPVAAASHLDTLAYVIPRYSHVDIPIHPSASQPKFVFTEPLSGCTIVVDHIGDHFRVYHVNGGQENAEYNSEPDHGFGQVTAMEYRNYGYHTKNLLSNEYHENIMGVSYMAYLPEERKWLMYTQSVSGAGQPCVKDLSVKSGKLKATLALAPNIQVEKMTLTLLPNKRMQNSRPSSSNSHRTSNSRPSSSNSQRTPGQ